MQSLDRLFVHDLNDILAAERQLAETLDRLSRESTNQQLQQIFSAHLAETQNHIARLQQVFATIDEQPTPTRCQGIAGIVGEHDQFVGGHQPSPPIHAAFDACAGMKVERFEITAYEALLRQANALGLTQAAQLLQATLADERRQLSRLQDAATSVDLSRLPAQPQAQRPAPSQPTGGPQTTSRS